MLGRNGGDVWGVRLGRVSPMGEDIVLNIVLAYSDDYGSCESGAHNGDSERVALRLELLTANDAVVTGAYTAAHEFASNDHSRVFVGADLALLRFAQDLNGNVQDAEPRWLIFSSQSKHASYANAQICEEVSSLICLEEFCGPAIDQFEEWLEYPGVADFSFTTKNVGEPHHPLIESLDDVGFFGDDAWADQEFCGGHERTDCISSLRSKFLHNPFDTSNGDR